MKWLLGRWAIFGCFQIVRLFGYLQGSRDSIERKPELCVSFFDSKIADNLWSEVEGVILEVYNEVDHTGA